RTATLSSSCALRSPPPPRSPLFPYTTLFRSSRRARGAHAPQAERGGARGSHLRLAGVQVREIQRHRLRARRGHHRHRRRSDEPRDRKSTRLNSSHLGISYAVFCLKKKKRETR